MREYSPDWVVFTSLDAEGAEYVSTFIAGNYQAY